MQKKKDSVPLQGFDLFHFHQIRIFLIGLVGENLAAHPGRALRQAGSLGDEHADPAAFFNEIVFSVPFGEALSDSDNTAFFFFFLIIALPLVYTLQYGAGRTGNILSVLEYEELAYSYLSGRVDMIFFAIIQDEAAD